MTQIFTGSGLGIHGSSLDRLYGHGARGSAGLGQGGDAVYVNAANGNVVLKHTDGFLAGHSLGLDVFETYNSRAGSHAWRFNFESRLDVTGEPNTAGSKVVRTDEDGHAQSFVYDAVRKIYTAEDGGTARLVFGQNHWEYREDTGERCAIYNTQGQLIQIQNRDGHTLDIQYEQGILSRVTDTAGRQSASWIFEHGLLRDIRFESEGKTIHHLHYDYDAQQRVSRITRDLGENTVYWTSYAYAGDSNLISDVSQSDGTRLHLEYDAQGRAYA